jgi:hypothetical protein
MRTKQSHNPISAYVESNIKANLVLAVINQIKVYMLQSLFCMKIISYTIDALPLYLENMYN